MQNRIVELHCTNPQPEAIGRLATWNLENFTKVDIYNDGKKDFVANYSSEANDRVYVIGAIWHEDTQKFTFHS